MKRSIFYFLSILLLAGSAMSEDEDSDTTEAPQAGANSTIVPTDYICRACVCKDGMVNCNNQNVQDFFSAADWAGLTDFKPLQVDLSNNELKSVTHVLELPIEVLNLSRNSIDTMEKASFRDLQKIRVLDLSHNRLTSAALSPHVFEGRYSPEEYEPLATMRTLSLAYNDLHSINQDLFEHLTELTELDMSGNPLMFIDHVTLIAISSLPQLKILRLRSCQLKEIPDKFLHTPRYLERLDISDNQLTAVPQELEETKNLVYLNINQNPIVRLDKKDEDFLGFPTLSKLKELHMSNMPELTYIGEGTLSGLENLESLHMCLNEKLSYIHPKALARVDGSGEAYVWPTLKELYIHSNNLSEVDSRLVARWNLLEAIDVSNNPYLCECSTQWMVDVLTTVVEMKKENASSLMVCQEPIEMRGKTMKHLHDIHRTMRCVDKYGNRPERDGAILMGCLIGVLLAVPIMLTIVLLWRRGYFAWIGASGPSDFHRAFYKRAPHEENNYI
ncbi:hypothetical protein JYU34_021713 [Plutella xylostella]|uniref:Uncharacterized protein n=1 Tax=Plutella xylostella TaxID=51655 RepID=A0ABQ7PR98_PLUXY|nr:hypothetical protein JYU34_021713 [Plutella xylostella]